MNVPLSTSRFFNMSDSQTLLGETGKFEHNFQTGSFIFIDWNKFSTPLPLVHDEIKLLYIKYGRKDKLFFSLTAYLKDSATLKMNVPSDLSFSHFIGGYHGKHNVLFGLARIWSAYVPTGFRVLEGLVNKTIN